MIAYRIGLLPGISTSWLAGITHVREVTYFVDEQRAGPHRLRHHKHHFHPAADSRGVAWREIVTRDVGRGPLCHLLHALWIGCKLAAVFDHCLRGSTELFPASP